MDDSLRPQSSIERGHKEVLLGVADRAIGTVLATGRRRLPDPGAYAAELRLPAATFVTLERAGELLGCVGALHPVRPLVVDVAHNAVAAAFSDPRFPPVDVDDYEHMSIKISVLSAHEPLAAVSYLDVIDSVRPYADGLVVHSGTHRATLLPSVWPNVRDAGSFCEHLWLKAGLVPGTWPPGTHVARYTTEEFAGSGAGGSSR
jgi:AmmeMemoRadiSam system protein A